MNKAQAITALKRPLKFGDRRQIAAYERLETQVAAERQLADLPELIMQVKPTGIELDQWDVQSIQDGMDGDLYMPDAEVRMSRMSREAA